MMNPLQLSGIFILPTLHGVLVALIWVLSLARLQSILRSNRDFPSRWRTFQALLIIITLFLVTGYLACLIRSAVLNHQVIAIGSSKGKSADGDQELTLADFTGREVAIILGDITELHSLLIATRCILVFSLWLAKFAFLTYFFGNTYCLRTAQRWTLWTVSGLVLVMFAVNVWIVSKEMFGTATELELRPGDIVTMSLTNGTIFMLVPQKYEYAMACTSIAADIMITSTACYIVRATRNSSRALILLLGMLLATFLTACSRLAVYSEFNVVTAKLGSGVRASHGKDAVSIDMKLRNARWGITAAVYILLDLEVLLSVIVSCVPGLRAFVRRGKSGRRSADAREKAGVEVVAGKDQPLEFLRDEGGASGERL